MNRIDRLFGLLLALQRRRRVRAQDLADQFEISRRTVYRDLSALSQMGVPIASLPGEGFELVEGYYLPPLMFRENEAVALLLGARLLSQQAGGSFAGSADEALAKILVVLPEQLRRRVEALTEIIGFITPAARFDLDDPQLMILQKAIQAKQLIHLRYHGYQKDEITERDVEPHRLFYSDGIWYLEGYCRLRKDVREFRLSRMKKLTPRKEVFVKRRAGKTASQRMLEIRMRFEARAAQWVHERQHYGFQHADTLPDGDVIMTYHVHDTLEITPWILSWGASVEVLSPRNLRKSLRETAAKVANLLT